MASDYVTLSQIKWITAEELHIFDDTGHIYFAFQLRTEGNLKGESIKHLLIFNLLIAEDKKFEEKWLSSECCLVDTVYTGCVLHTV